MANEKMGSSLILLKGLVDEDFVNYSKPSMFVIFPFCTFKCGYDLCQNKELFYSKTIKISANTIVERYINNPITKAICFGGLEPMDSFDTVLNLIKEFRFKTDDDIVIYSGYTKEEIKDKIAILKLFDNIVIKYGRYIPNQESHYDNVLGVNLISDNQYAERIS